MASSKPEGSKLTSSNFDDFNGNLQSAALKATRHALSLPADLAFHRSMDAELSEDLEAFSSRVLSVANNLLRLVSTADTRQHQQEKGKLSLEGQDDVVDSFKSLVVDVMEPLLERADMNLDEHAGHIKPPAIDINPVQPVVQKKSNVPRGRLDPALQHASHLPKPQLKFKKKVDNNDMSPWRPTLPHKYNAQVPLGYTYQDTDGNVNTRQHPYQYEITHIKYPTRMFQSLPPIPPKSFDETPFSWVSTPLEFAAMLDKLRIAKEVAVDLEHHSYRSWSGFVCLMQISTREEDFVVDTLALREELQELNEVFTDPEIVKVFHGAESDIIWLQQDFNLYVVNLFDTFHASRILEFSRHGLVNLLEAYCDFTPDKRYQLADWRIRPLPEEMLMYARSDTHFLLYIYDNLRNALLDRAQTSPPEPSSSVPTDIDPASILIYEVLSRSEDTALRVYEKEIYDAEEGGGPGGWDTLAKKWNKGLLMKGAPGGVQRDVYKRLHAWRDQVAREEDESRMFILTNNYLFQLAERPPKDMAALLSIFKTVPPLVRRRARELLDLIQETLKVDREDRAAIETPSMQDSMTTTEVREADVEVTTIATDVLDSKLWSNGAGRGRNHLPSSTTVSNLFGSTIKASGGAESSSYSTSKSTLFNEKQGSSQAHTTNTPFNLLVSRIHSKLVIAPSAPKVKPDKLAEMPNPSATTSDVTMHEPSESNHQPEIPYIPSSQRQPVNATDDSIVVVGQARQKKRKRIKATTQEDDLQGIEHIESNGEAVVKTKKSKKKVDQNSSADPEEIFDYSAVPNILDDVPTPEYDKSKRKKKQKQNKGGVAYGDFPAPPKAHRELKSGNQSFTFK